MRNLNISPEGRFSKRWLSYFLLASIVVACFTTLCYAIDPGRTLAQYIRERWGVERGFPSGSVSSFAQTADGYLWIGTDKGLIRFDGLNFRRFPQAVPTNYPIGAVQSLLADKNGGLWVLLKSTKILFYHNGRFELGRDEAEYGISSMGTRKDGSVLFSSLAFGILTYADGEFEALASASTSQSPRPPATRTPGAPDELSSRLSWATGVLIHRYAEPNTAVTAIAETSEDTIWMGTQDKGLFYMSEGKVATADKGLSIARINCLLPLENRELWVGTDKGVMRWTGTELTETGVPSSLQRLAIFAMIRDRDSNIWLGTQSGLLRANSRGVSIDSAIVPGKPATTALFEDRDGNIWTGSSRGIERLRESAFVTYSVGVLQSESSGPVYVDDDERAWFAPFEGGLHWLKGEESGSVSNDGLAQDIIYSISGGKDELWIGRQQGGLTHLRYSGSSFTAKTYTRKDGLAQNSVYAVHEDRNGTVWAGTLSGGLSQFRDGHFTTYTTAQGLAANTVSAIAEGPDGALWFATPAGLSELKNGAWSSLKTADGLPSENVNCLLPEPDNVLWIGTASGIAYLRAGKISVPLREPDSLHEPILGMARDKYEWLWISTSNHLLRVRADKLLAGAAAESDFREFGLEDGLLGAEGVKRFQSVFEDRSGEIWFSTNRGLSVVSPSRLKAASPPTQVQIESLSVDGTPMGIQGFLRFPGPSRRVTFNYAGLNLSVPDRVRFKYKLEPIDDGWSEPVTTHEATYNGLGSGSYRFHVMASNSDSLWNSADSTLQFEIAKAYWQTWWFRIAAILVALFGSLLFFRLRLRKVSAQMNMRFEERLAERTRIAQELHDTLLQGFLSASMQLHVADDFLPADSPAKPLVSRVLSLMTRVIEDGRNTLRGLRSPGTAPENLEEAFSRIQQEFAVSNHAGFRIFVEGTPRLLHSAIRDDLYSICREALTNAFRHSAATQIEIELEYRAHHLRILVRDNGRGIDQHVLTSGRDGHWGLSGMRERAERIGAKLSVLSRPAAGTEVELSVPSRIAFAPEGSKRRPGWMFWENRQNARVQKPETKHSAEK